MQKTTFLRQEMHILNMIFDHDVAMQLKKMLSVIATHQTAYNIHLEMEINHTKFHICTVNGFGRVKTDRIASYSIDGSTSMHWKDNKVKLLVVVRPCFVS